jgi:ketosteroid isomerase-like protein
LPAREQSKMNQELNDFQQFMRERARVAGAYVRGDAGPLGRIVTHAAPATFFAPGGGVEKGALQVYSRYETDAARFSEGESELEILHMGTGDGLAYWVGIQHASVRMEPGAPPVGMNLRVTELFRRQGTEWKLVHRHADPLEGGVGPG